MYCPPLHHSYRPASTLLKTPPPCHPSFLFSACANRASTMSSIWYCRMSKFAQTHPSSSYTLRLRFAPALHPLTITPFSLPLSALPHFIIWYPSPERTPLFSPSPFSVIHWERKNLHAFLVHPFFILRRVPFIPSSFLFSLFVIRV